MGILYLPSDAESEKPKTINETFNLARLSYKHFHRQALDEMTKELREKFKL